MKSPLKYQHAKKSIIGLVSVGILMVIGYIISENIALKNQLSKKQSPNETVYHYTNQQNTPSLLEKFDPNDYSKKDWMNIGFSEKQATSILKYRKLLGGKFQSKQEIQACYVISDKKFNSIKAFLLLPDYAHHQQDQTSYKRYQKVYSDKKKTLHITKKFNPNTYDVNDWINIGFSRKQAISIVKYKKSLGGTFHSKEELRASYMIDEEKYLQLERFLILPNKNETSYSLPNIPKNSHRQLSPFDPNTLSEEGWQQLGFTERQARSILKYKKYTLKGRFKNIDDVKNSYMISDKKFEELKPYIILPQKKVSEIHEPAEIKSTDFTKIDLNEITYHQLVAFGFDKKSANRIIGFRKSLGGFIRKEQVFETYKTDTELIQKLLKTITLNTDNVPKYTFANAPESWLKKHPYFKYSADKIIFYRTSYPTSKKIWKRLKTPTKYRRKMEWYLLED